nr:N1R/p28 family protein [Oriental turtle dovepox virus]
MRFNNIITGYIDQEFCYIQYYEFHLVMMISNCYINTSKLCNTFYKDFKKWLCLDNSLSLLQEIENTNFPSEKKFSIKNSRSIIILDKYYHEEVEGYYVHPDILPHIIGWLSPTFAIKMSKFINGYVSNSFTITGKDDKKYNTLPPSSSYKQEDNNCFIDMLTELTDKHRNDITELKTHYREQKRELKYQNNVLTAKITELKNVNDEIRYKIKHFDNNIKEIKDENTSLKTNIKITEKHNRELQKDNNRLKDLIRELHEKNTSLNNNITELRETIARETKELHNQVIELSKDKGIEPMDEYRVDRCFVRNRFYHANKKNYIVIFQHKKDLFMFKYFKLHIRKVCIELFNYREDYNLFLIIYEPTNKSITRFKNMLENNDQIEIKDNNFKITGTRYTFINVLKDINKIFSDN